MNIYVLTTSDNEPLFHSHSLIDAILEMIDPAPDIDRKRTLFVDRIEDEADLQDFQNGNNITIVSYFRQDEGIIDVAGWGRRTDQETKIILATAASCSIETNYEGDDD